ncbi:hypothetical protein MKQ70_08515 [Chitinophaga sedimenti]|uniref:hypothetical protein n=1 Tax=Chitinophaga sedimenti TaxID=2033606 RepID=UPI002005DBF4|nr:hypothetical protein [Chitinophaga sedimenti]MCK7555049.1 hypothetical protein [Chitinophaga sedimenti]
MTLKNVLLINAISSGATGIFLATSPTFFSRLFDVQSTVPFAETGIFLIVFALFVFITALATPVKKSLAKIITGLDITWVVASVAAVVLLFTSISIIGSIIIIGVAAWVGLMAYLQSRKLENS